MVGCQKGHMACKNPTPSLPKGSYKELWETQPNLQYAG